MKLICFLSDFGLSGDFVGTCKGVMLGIAPDSAVVDLTHEVSSFGLEPGAEVLEHATRYMPEDTVYLAVIDPEVGTARRAVAIRSASGSTLVGPDNGLLLPAADALGGIEAAVHLTNERFHLHPVSSTFHGRDIFSPAAAHLAAGVELAELGETVDPASLVRLDPPKAIRVSAGREIETKVLDVDRYGNVRLSATQDEPDFQYGASLTVSTGESTVDARYVETFGASKIGDLLLVPDSHRRLSISINQGNAARAQALKVGDRVRLVLTDEHPGR